MTNRAVFLDRDGVINPLVYNLSTNEYESPHYVEDFSVFPYVVRSIEKLIQKDFKIFLITNQPSYAKGKTTLENIHAIHASMDLLFVQHNIKFTNYYYCYHHPQGIVPEYSEDCDCRKPKSKFLKDAEKDYGIDLKNSWLIGDQDSDIQCGQSQGLKTVQVENKHSIKKRGTTVPDYYAQNLQHAVDIICDTK
jgi:D-glycero-D-manno-heptose 1,7-bisphosphate phosphatase